MNTDGTIGSRISETISYNTTSSTKVVNDGSWHHVLVTWGSGGIKQYIDGMYDGYSSYASAWTSNATMYLGATEAYQGTYNWYGQIDEARFYNYALTQTQVKELYAGGAVSFGE